LFTRLDREIRGKYGLKVWQDGDGTLPGTHARSRKSRNREGISVLLNQQKEKQEPALASLRIAIAAAKRPKSSAG
jgi:hypothetical protein